MLSYIWIVFLYGLGSWGTRALLYVNGELLITPVDFENVFINAPKNKGVAPSASQDQAILIKTVKKIDKIVIQLNTVTQEKFPKLNSLYNSLANLLYRLFFCLKI
ncbi:MAG: hypothetical protein PHC37_01700, partial [Candidatus Omnitrophica bacterium]|nr:hypothetical protein [Candidatus Omnitrophota bacterium]